MIHFKAPQRQNTDISNSTGFTIVELMVALAVLSTMLLISSVTLITIGKLFTKNLNEIQAQNTARGVMNDVASAIQLGGKPPIQFWPAVNPPHANQPSGVGTLCVGNVRYSYILNGKLNKYSGGASYNHVLWRDTLTSSGACPSTPLPMGSPTPTDSNSVGSSGEELMPLNMRLTDFEVTQTTNSTWVIKVTVAYGDDDLVQYTPPPAVDTTHSTGKTNCINTGGTEYCAVSSLTQTVVQRIIQE